MPPRRPRPSAGVLYPAVQVPGGGTAQDGKVQIDGDDGNFEHIPKLEGLQNGYYNGFFRVACIGSKGGQGDEDFTWNRWEDRYRQMMDIFRANLALPMAGDDNQDLMIMPPKTDELKKKLMPLVLYTSTGSWVQILFKMEDIYVVGFKNRHGSYRMSDYIPDKYDETNWVDLGFPSTYGDLRRIAGRKATSEEISLGKGAMQTLVMEHLTAYNKKDKDRVKADDEVALAVLIIAIMFAEGARFRHISNGLMEKPFEEFVSLSDEQLKHVNNWSKMSKFITAANMYPDRINVINRYLEQEFSDIKIQGETVTNVQALIGIVRILSREDDAACHQILVRALEMPPLILNMPAGEGN